MKSVVGGVEGGVVGGVTGGIVGGLEAPRRRPRRPHRPPRSASAATSSSPPRSKDVKPVYPAIAQSARVQGVVIIEATIGPNGAVQEAKVLRSIPLLDAAALDAVRQWQFTPTLLNGVPVPVIMTVTGWCPFRLGQDNAHVFTYEGKPVARCSTKAWKAALVAGRDRTDVSLARSTPHLGVVACAERNPVAGANGARQLGQLTRWSCGTRIWQRITFAAQRAGSMTRFWHKRKARNKCGLRKALNRWCPGTESNRRHGDFQSPALPTELPGQRARHDTDATRSGQAAHWLNAHAGAPIHLAWAGA